METQSPPGTSPGIGKRHGQTMVYFLGRVILHSLRVNLSVGVVAMTSESNSNSPVVDWDTRQIGIISSMEYYGMMVTELTAGFCLRRFGSSILMTSATVICGLSSLLMPYIAVNVGFEAACVLRIISGIGEGGFFPAIITHTSKWAVQSERGVMYTVVLSGSALGAILMLSTSGFIATSPLGWPGIYYIPGVLAVLWGIVEFTILRDSPSAHKTISKAERDWIHSGLPDSDADRNKNQIPWKEILTSGRVWIGIATAIFSEWGHSLNANLTPTYLSGVLGISISKNGILSCLPYIVNFLLTSFSGFASDFLIRNKYLPVWASRRLWTGLALYGGAAGLVVLGTVSFGVAGTVSILSLASGLHGTVYSGVMLMPIDLTPNFSGIVSGLQLGFSNIGSICAPTVAGIIVTDKHNTYQWQLMFLLTGGLYFLGCSLYIIFGSTKIQSWNKPKTDFMI